MARYEGAEAFIEAMNANKVQNVFYNPGYDVVPILGALSRYKTLGKSAPNPILCLDESVALAAAHGNYMVSGLPQVVLVHSEIGTLQVGGALHQAHWGRVPVVLCAGLKEPVERLNWLGQPYDQGSIVRNCVKWDHFISKKENFYTVLQKAFHIATTEPNGPVYLWFPRESLFEKIDIEADTPAPMHTTISTPEFDIDTINKAVEMLMSAVNPLIMVSYSGRHQQSVASLVELAETLGARLVTTPVRVNFPSNHPLCAFVEPNDGIQVINPYLSSADVLLLIDYDLPYATPRDMPGQDTRIIHIDIDHVKQGVPLWNRKADIIIKADSSKAIPAIIGAIHQRLTSEHQTRFRNRSIKLQQEHQTLRNEWRKMAKNASDQKPLSAEWVCYCINEVIDQDTIIVDQTIGPAAAVARQIPRLKPGTLVGCAGGSIGWALGASLGAKIAAPNKTVIGLMGDGAFIFGCPTATLWSATFYKAAFLSVIFNNQEYGAIKKAFKMSNLEGCKGAEITPSPNYALTAQSCGAYGKIIQETGDVLPTLIEAIEQIRKGRPAVLDVRI